MGGFLPVPDRVAFTVFGLDVMWYGVLLAGGMVAGVLMSYYRAEKKGLNKEHVLDFAIYCIPAGAIGSRLYYVAFEWGYYSKHLSEILNIRSGGLAIHGGILFGVGLGIILCKKWKLEVPKWIDVVSPGIAIAQAIGRWGNYFNSEAHGGPTNLPWAIEVDGVLVHPTFLYESIWCLLLCIFLLWFDRSKYKRFDGQLFLLYAGLYSFERYFVESLRTDSLMIGPFRQAQLLSLAVIVACTVAYVYMLRKKDGEEAAEAAAATETILSQHSSESMEPLEMSDCSKCDEMTNVPEKTAAAAEAAEAVEPPDRHSASPESDKM